MDLPPQQSVAVPPVRRSSGCGCCAGGCLTFLVMGILALILVVACAWYLGDKAIREFTASQPANVAVEMPSDEQFGAADAKLNQLRAAVRAQQSATIAFTAADLNALIARHPDFSPRKGKMRIKIADSIATVEMSVPLETIELRRVKHRWFNGSASFGFIFAQEGFEFDPQWIEANGHHVSSKLLGWTARIFNRSFSKGFERAVSEDADSGDFWKNIKTMTLDDDRLVIITKGQLKGPGI